MSRNLKNTANKEIVENGEAALDTQALVGNAKCKTLIKVLTNEN
jgi:hypothetical protein